MVEDNTIDESVYNLMSSQFDKQNTILAPWLRSSELVLLFAPRGIGKTYFALSMAYALAHNKPFLGWSNNSKVKVHYIDGEMGRRQLANRLKQLDRKSLENLDPQAMRVLTFEHCGGIMWNLSNIADQHSYKQVTATSDVIIIDNLLSCSRSLNNRDDDVQQWERIQPWLINRRAEGKTVILIHHAGKSGLQLGTSTRENVMDTIINLKYSRLSYPEDGSAFELHFEKARNFYGKDAKPNHIEYTTHDNQIYWKTENLYKVRKRAVIEAMKTISSKQLIATKLDIPLYLVMEIVKEHQTELKGDKYELF